MLILQILQEKEIPEFLLNFSKVVRWGVFDDLTHKVINHLRSLFCFIIFTNPSARAGYDTRSTFKVWIQSFPSPRLVASLRLKNPVFPTILPIAGGTILGFIPFPRVLVLCEMQSVLSRFWTRVAVSISYDDNHYSILFYGISNFVGYLMSKPSS